MPKKLDKEPSVFSIDEIYNYLKKHEYDLDLKEISEEDAIREYVGSMTKPESKSMFFVEGEDKNGLYFVKLDGHLTKVDFVFMIN